LSHSKTNAHPPKLWQKCSRKEVSKLLIIRHSLFIDGYWIYHSEKVNVTSLFSAPEEKLWLVVQDYQGGLESESYNLSATKEIPIKRGFRIEKNSVIKLGRVRLRVRDLDTSDRPRLAKKKEKVKSALLSTKGEKGVEIKNDMVDINEIELIEEAQN